MISLLEVPTPSHPLFSEPDNCQYWQTFRSSNAGIITRVAELAAACDITAEFSAPDSIGNQYALRIFASETEFDSLIRTAGGAL